jgi:hypothetical protein
MPRLLATALVLHWPQCTGNGQFTGRSGCIEAIAEQVETDAGNVLGESFDWGYRVGTFPPDRWPSRLPMLSDSGWKML